VANCGAFQVSDVCGGRRGPNTVLKKLPGDKRGFVVVKTKDDESENISAQACFVVDYTDKNNGKIGLEYRFVGECGETCFGVWEMADGLTGEYVWKGEIAAGYGMSASIHAYDKESTKLVECSSGCMDTQEGEYNHSRDDLRTRRRDRRIWRQIGARENLRTPWNGGAQRFREIFPQEERYENGER